MRNVWVYIFIAFLSAGAHAGGKKYSHTVRATATGDREATFKSAYDNAFTKASSAAADKCTSGGFNYKWGSRTFGGKNCGSNKNGHKCTISVNMECYHKR